MTKQVFAGVDVGASRTKAAVVDGAKRLLGHCVLKSGTDFDATAALALDKALESAGIFSDAIVRCVATGYGRKNVAAADATHTEIGCHARGCYHYFHAALTIVDIGGQDNKVIMIDENGRRLGFKMNRKCAAGTGAFLEEMSARLGIPLEEMDQLARSAEETVELGSYCTVFSATEVLEKIRQGAAVPAIVKGLFLSVIKRILEMHPLTGTVAMTGGVVAHNPFLVNMIAEMLGKDIMVPDHPQLTGAVGAALIAMDR
ncbi:MAG TPA: ATPase [Desulfobacteraceae bacterium]|nr:ATPase [Desulfobacteraceae bacterium]